MEVMRREDRLTASDQKRRPYQQPYLQNYGSVSTLTAMGTGSGEEGGNPDAGPGCMEDQSSGPCKASDRSTKDNIVRIGSHPLGIGLYLFDYKPAYRETWGHGRQFGVMADEVDTVMPQAVCVHPDGYKMVNYAMLGISHTAQ